MTDSPKAPTSPDSSPPMKAVRIQLLDLRSVPMRAFHMSWVAFFLCFFGWFGIAPLMPVVRQELGLSREQIGNTIIASVAITIVARLFIGRLCDTIGPRKAYGGLLLLGPLPVMGIGLADSYETFLFARLCIGAIGASFVITQCHTSMMFAPNVVGTANATTAGWGNMGGGITNMVMPLVLAAFLSIGVNEALGWRLAMVVPGMALFVMGILYLKLTQDTPEGNLADLAKTKQVQRGTFREAARDRRVWALFVIYGACFGVELTINNVAATYFFDRFEVSIATAGLIAGSFGAMNLFARTLGGVFGDRAGIRHGLKGRVAFLGACIALEAVALMIFSQVTVLGLAIATLIVFSLFVQMSEGATFSIVPMINPRCLGAVSGIVGAGGNAGAVAAGFLFRSESLTDSQAFFLLGGAVLATSVMVTFIRFSASEESQAREEVEASLLVRRGLES